MTPADLIKPLVWHNFDAWTWWAEFLSGTYHVEERNGKWRVDLRFSIALHVIAEVDGFEDAQAAAQADYTARILSALDPDAIARIRADALREAATKATSFLVGDPKNDIPLRNPMAHEIAAAILALIEKEKDDE